MPRLPAVALSVFYFLQLPFQLHQQRFRLFQQRLKIRDGLRQPFDKRA